jgi:hypothetical protein
LADRPTQPIPLLAVIRGAFVLPARHAGELFRAASLPLLALIAVTLLGEFQPTTSNQFLAWIPYLVYVAVFSWLAVTVHRLVLLDAGSSSQHFNAEAWKRVGVYFVAFAFIGILFLFIKFLLFNVIGIVSGISYVPTGEQPNLVPRQWLGIASSLAALLGVSPFVMVLPAIATDRGHEISESRRISRGNLWRLAVVFGVFPWVLSLLNGLLFRDGGTGVEYALILIFGCVLAIVEITALSLAYAALTEPAPPPTDPPA